MIMTSANPEYNPPRDRLHIALIGATTIATILVSIYCLISGSFIVFQNLFYIPIILSCMYYTVRGFVYSVCLSALYMILIFAFTSEHVSIMQAMVLVVLFIAIAGVVTFLSLRHARAMEKVRENSETFRRLFEDSTDPVLLLDDGGFVDCNPACVAIFEYGSKDDVIKKQPWELSPQYQPDGRLSSEKAPEMLALAVLNGHHRFEWIHLKPDNTEFPVEVMLTSVVIRGRQLQHVAWRDISARKQAEEALKESEEKYHSIFESVTEGIFQTTLEGRFRIANPALARIYGYSSPEDLIGAITDIGTQLYVDPDERSTFLRILYEKGSIQNYEVQLKRKDGSPFWAS